MAEIAVSRTSARASLFDSPGITYHGALSARRAGQHLFDSDLVLGALLTISPILVIEFPPLQRIGSALLEPAKLLTRRDVYPELGEHHAFGDEGPLEVDDLRVGLTPLLYFGEPFDPFDENSPVPGPVEDRDTAPTRRMRPEALQPVVTEFILCRRRAATDSTVVRT